MDIIQLLEKRFWPKRRTKAEDSDCKNLASKPNLLILDEATSALDYDTNPMSVVIYKVFLKIKLYSSLPIGFQQLEIRSNNFDAQRTDCRI